MNEQRIAKTSAIPWAIALIGGLVAALILSTGHSARSLSAAPRKPAFAAHPRGSTAQPRAIATLKGRHETVVIYATSGKGPRFTIFSAEGRTRARQLPLERLSSQYPELFELYRRAYVNVWAAD